MEDGDAIAQRLNGVTPLLEPDILKNARRCELENQPMASENGTNRDSCCSSASSSSSNASASASPPPSKNGESTFKTPSAPSRRPNGPLKKRADGAPDSETPANPEQDPGDANAKTSEDPETRPEVPATTSDAIDAAAEKSAENQKEAEQAAVLPTSVCPNTQKCFTERYPNLPAKSLSDPKVDLLDEMVVDDYSLILFNSYTDYKIFKVHEDEVLERERQEERQRQVEEAARIAKLKKKGRKSKAQLEKAQRIARRTERRERRERERVERREVRRRERQEKKSRGEPLIKPDKQERQARRERREQRIRERQERQREKRERHEREREARRQQQKLQKPTLAHPAAVGSQPLGAAHASAIGISDLAQHRQRFEQLYHMRKPATPATSNMEELVAAAAVLAAANHAENPNQNGRLPTVRVTLDPHPPTSSALHKAATNENAISDSSRSDPSVLKRPGAVTAGVKRPLSELDQQQQNGPQGKLMKYEDLQNEYKKMLFNQSPQQSRRNSLQPQQQMGLGQLNYPFLGGLPPTADPSFRFAVPQHQIPMGLQRAAAAQQLGQLPPGVSAAAMADMLQHPFSPLTSMMNAVNANNAKTTAASSAAQSSMPGQTTSGVQPKAEVPNPLDFTPHHVFANNPDFASTLQQALSAMNAVDPGLLGVNAPLLGMGLPGQIPGLSMMGPNGLVNPLTEAHRQLEAIQLQQHQKALAQQLAAQQKPSASNTPKHMMQQGQNISGGNPPSKTPQSTSATPSRKTSKVSARPPPSQSRCSTAAGTSSQPPPAADAQLLINSLVGKHPNPALVRHPQMALNAAGIQQAGRPGAEVAQPPTVPLSRPITPSFASSIGIQFPPGTALASQLAGAAMLGGKASFSSRNPTSSRWNRLHVDVAETLQQVFAESPEMDDGSREGQSCPPFPRDYRLVPATGAQVGGRVNPAENPNGSTRPQESSGGNRQPSGSGQDASRPSTSKHERPRSRSHSPAEKRPKLSRTEQPEGGRSSNRPSGHDTPSSQASTANSASAAMAAVAGAIERQQKLQAGGHDPSAAQLGNQLAAGQGAPFSVADVTNLSASDAFLRQQLLASSAGAGMNQEAAKPAGQGGSDSRMQPPPQSAAGANRPGTGPGARFSSQTPAPAASSASQSSSVAMHAAAALHPALGAIGLPQQEQLRQQQLQQAAKLHPMARALLPNNLPANSMTPDGANMMNFLYQQHQQAQRQQKTQQEQEAETMRQLQLMEKEMQKKTEMAMRQKEEESQRARQQAQQRSQLSAAQQQRPGPSNQQQQQQAQLAQQQQQLQLQQQQQFLAALAGMPMQAAASGAGGQPLVPPNYLQNLPAATQFMLQQMMPGQQQPGASTAAQTAGLPANFLEALVAQSAAGQGQQAAQVSAAQSQATNLALQQQQAALRQAQQRLNPQSSAPNFTANFPPPAAAQPSLTHGTAGNAASNAARPGVDQNQLYALSLLQNQAHALDAQAREATASVQAAQNPFGQLNANAMNNPEAFRQLQQNMLERSMNPALYAQLLQAQQQHQQQQSQQLQMQLVQQLQQQHQMQQRGIAPINPNQLASLVGGMPSMMEAELLMRQMSGQQLPSNLQRTAQDRDQIVEQHRLFQQQLMAAANTANDPTAAGSSVLPPGMYNASAAQLAAQLRNGAAGPMGNMGQKK